VQNSQSTRSKSGRLYSQVPLIVGCLAIGYFLNDYGTAAEVPVNKPADTRVILEPAAIPEFAIPVAVALEAESEPEPEPAEAQMVVEPEPVTDPVVMISEAVVPELPLVEPAPAADGIVADVAPEAVEAPRVKWDAIDPSDWSLEEEGPPELDYVASLSQGGTALPEGFDTLEPGTLTRLTWHAGESLYGSAIPTPVLVAQGIAEGPTLCVTSAVHGDELNGIETVRQMMYSINPEELTGRVIGVPIVNLQAFERHSRYLPDRRDLNRFFPGNPNGSFASRVAYSLFEQVIRRCSALVDLHTGSFHRTNLPQLRADLERPDVVALTEGFGSTVILHSSGGEGTLRAAAVNAGIPAVTLEAGEPLRVDERAVKHSTKALFTLMNTMGMYKRPSLWGNPEPTYYGSQWVRADKGGMLIGTAKLGRRVQAGDVLGTVVDPITNAKQELRAPASGRIIGMALNQFVMPGYAAFHLGIEAPSIEALEQVPEDPGSGIDHSVAQFSEIADDRDDSE
jgi:predicted deacylase